MSLSRPPVTIVTPVYNQRRDYLNEAAASVFRQADGQWRWLIADNASSSPEVASWLEDLRKDSRVEILQQERNLGLFPNLNAALEKVESPFVLLLCSDDRLADDAVSRFLGMAERLPAGDLFLASLIPIDENGGLSTTQHTVYRDAQVSETRVIPRKEALELVFRYASINGNLTGMFFRRELFDRVGRFNDDLPQTADWEWVYRAIKKGSLVLSRDLVADVRTHPGQLSGTNGRSGVAARDCAVVIRELLSDEELRHHPSAARWARDIMMHHAWQATRAAVRGDIRLAKCIASEIESATGLFPTFAYMIAKMPARLDRRLRGRMRLPPA